METLFPQMAAVRLCLLAAILLECSLAHRTVRYVAFNPPVVYPQRDFVTVKARSRQLLTCEGHRPVQWHIPQAASKLDRLRVTYSTSDAADRRYTTNLEIRETVYTDTGTYVCSFNGTEDLTSIDNNTALHMYVYDQVHLLTREDFDFQQFVQYETAVIPCTTTHPNITVDLSHEGRGDIPLDNIVSFSPKVGFLISPILPEHTGLYTCTAKFEGKTSKYHSNVRVLPKTSYVPPPYINKTSGEHVTVGQNLILSCTITVEWSVQVRLTWSVPNMAANMPRLDLPEPVSRNVTLGGKPLKVVEQRLLLTQVEKEDQGNYECIVTDHSGNKRNKREFIRIYERDQSFLRVWQDGSSVLQKAAGRDEVVQWVVHAASHPPPRISWYDPDNQLIAEGEDRKRGRTMQIIPGKNYRSMLRLKDLKLEDSGEYRVHVDNGEQEHWENLTLIVTVRPSVAVSILEPPENGLYMYGGQYTLRCTATGYPRPKVSWTFVRCKNYNACEKKPETLMATVDQENGRFQTDSALSVVASDSGRYTCIATANENAESSYLNFFITDVKAGFQISGQNNALEGERIELKCSASKYDYSEDSLVWYKQTVHGLQEMTQQKSAAAMTTSHDVEIYEDNTSRFSVVKGLRFREVQTRDSGVYVCRAARINGPKRRNIQDGTVRQDQLELRVQRYEPPEIYQTRNMENNETLLFDKGDGVEMSCMVRGTLMPTVKWYKDGQPLEDLASGNLQLLEDTQTLRIGVVVEGRDEGTYSCEARNKKGTAKRFQRIIKVEAPSIYQTNLLGEATDNGGDDAAAAKTGDKTSDALVDSANSDSNHKVKIIAAGLSMTLKCRVTGRPPPTITWLHNGVPLVAAAAAAADGDSQQQLRSINITDNNQTLVVEAMEAADAGRYTCVVANKGGVTSLYQVVRVEATATTLLASIYASGIAVPVSIAVGVAILLAAVLLLLSRLCWNRGRWKAPPTPPTPRLTQYDLPEEEDHEAESCRLTLSRDGSPFIPAVNGNANGLVCHGCNGCAGSCHQCSGCHYSFNGIYGCSAGYAGGSILGVRSCGTPGPNGYSPGSSQLQHHNGRYSPGGGSQVRLGQYNTGGSQVMTDFALYSQHTLPHASSSIQV